MNIIYAEEQYLDQIQKLFMQFYFLYRSALKLDIEKKNLLIAVDNYEVIGVIKANTKRNHIPMCVVKKEFRGKGIGKALFNKLIELENIPDIKLDAVQESIPFWYSLGFRETGKKMETKNKVLSEMIYICKDLINKFNK